MRFTDVETTKEYPKGVATQPTFPSHIILLDVEPICSFVVLNELIPKRCHIYVISELNRTNVYFLRGKIIR